MEPPYMVWCVHACLRQGRGRGAGQTRVDLYSDTISSSIVASVRQMVPDTGSSFKRHIHSHWFKYTHSLSAHWNIIYHFITSPQLWTITSAGVITACSPWTFHHRYQSVLLGRDVRHLFFSCESYRHVLLSCHHCFQSNNTWYFWLNLN